MQRHCGLMWGLIAIFVIPPTSFSRQSDVDELTDSHECSYHPPRKEEIVFDVQIGESENVTKRSIHQQLRIYLNFDSSISYLPGTHQSVIRELVQQAVRYWESTLLVRRSAASAIRLNRQCLNNKAVYLDRARYCVNGCQAQTKCGDYVIPEEHLEQCYVFDPVTHVRRSYLQAGPGVKHNDFILYAAALPSARCRLSKTIAFAAHCQQEVALDRPVAGYISICPNFISVETHERLQLLSTIKHEILHALGFSAGLYAFFRDSFGNPLTVRDPNSNKPPYDQSTGLYVVSDRVVKDFTRPRWKTANGYYNRKVTLMITPNVKREVQLHFKCSSLEGAELEDQGVPGTSLTHWEKRLFENEAMTGTYTQNPVISRVTLALMEDTGWYKARYEMADNLEWGKNLGCNFVMKSCKEWMDTHRGMYSDMHPFCEELRQGVLRTGCTRNHQALAFCNLVEYSGSLPQHYQYFSSSNGAFPLVDATHLGGSVKLADYCPYLQEFIWKNNGVSVRDSRCILPENNPKSSINFFGERYGANSMCINHGAELWTLQRCNSLMSTPHSGSGCYKYQCSSTAGLVISVQDKSYQCLQKNQKIRVRFMSAYYLHSGHIVCPSCQEICQKRGTTCPREETAYDIVNDNRPLYVPCSALSIVHMTSLNLMWTAAISNILCASLVWYFHR